MASGSAMYTRRVSVSKDPDFLKVVEKLRSADVSFMNFEGHHVNKIDTTLMGS